MNMMEENSEGRMEFPRDVMLEDCFSSSQEPLYGFVTNVTIPEDMLEPCLVGVECFENGTTIRDAINNQEINDNTDLTNSNVLPETFIKRQGIIQKSILFHLRDVVFKNYMIYMSLLFFTIENRYRAGCDSSADE